MDIVVLVDHRVKIKESKNIDKYLDLARELKKTWNTRVTVIPVVLKTTLKGLEKVGVIKDQLENRDQWDHTIVKFS